jgi:hypothetical protein
LAVRRVEARRLDLKCARIEQGDDDLGRVMLKPLLCTWIGDADITAGSELRFTLQATANKTWMLASTHGPTR